MYKIDEYVDVLEKVKGNLSGKRHLSEIDLPLIVAPSSDPADRDLGLITSENFLSSFEDDKPLLLQITSLGSNRCRQFVPIWERIVHLLNGVAKTALVELGDVKLAVYLAERKYTGQPFFRSGLPALVVFPPGCKDSSCLSRYEGELSIDAITDWLATSILSLPRIPYYSKESLVQNFLAKSKPHQVKVIMISQTGERATPFIRQAAKDYSPYATFAFALWREDESSFWWNVFGVESAPAIVFLKDPGVDPVVYQGLVNSSQFTDLMEKNKHHVLPQLRNVTAKELGCDVHGHSRAGEDVKVWYCAIVAGRPSQELNKMRGIIRSVQDQLSSDVESDIGNQDLVSAPATLALKQKRLTFAWLDGETQNRFCFFHIHSEDSFETCGPRRLMTDVARLIIIRYERNETNNEIVQSRKQTNNLFLDLMHTEADPVFTLVAKYNGSTEVPEIIKWISQTIKDGDAREIPPFKTKSPELVPEEGDKMWSRGSQKVVSSGKNIKHRAAGFVSSFSDFLGDPRIGPSLLLAALMSFGLIWLKRSQPAPSNNQAESESADRDRPSRRRRASAGSNQLVPPSITDEEPTNATQMSFQDSDSE
ncbi:uncharacterized protein LOC127240917 isoform X2 [Andrographis paniculata]|nr:uncharacterized protein LOC127240917 isoform X2 [Andrographis paniculata]